MLSDSSTPCPGSHTKHGIAAVRERAVPLVSLARSLGLTPGAVSSWKQVPAEHIGKVSEFTGLPHHIIRPDLFGINIEDVSCEAGGIAPTFSEALRVLVKINGIRAQVEEIIDLLHALDKIGDGIGGADGCAVSAVALNAKSIADNVLDAMKVVQRSDQADNLSTRSSPLPEDAA